MASNLIEIIGLLLLLGLVRLWVGGLARLWAIAPTAIHHPIDAVARHLAR